MRLGIVLFLQINNKIFLFVDETQIYLHFFHSLSFSATSCDFMFYNIIIPNSMSASVNLINNDEN